jgi:hypothetical protein
MSVLTGFNFSIVKKLQVLLFGFRQCDITHAAHRSAAADRHYITLVFFPSQTACELQLVKHLSSDCFCCCIATAVQIALSPNWGLARFSLKKRINPTCQPTIQQDTVPPAYIPSNPRLLPTHTFSSLLTHSEDPQVCNIVTLTEKSTAVLLLQEKNRKASPLPGTSGNVV